jgi:hypothetical protein
LPAFSIAGMEMQAARRPPATRFEVVLQAKEATTQQLIRYGRCLSALISDLIPQFLAALKSR